jgi:hypothetical protein
MPIRPCLDEIPLVWLQAQRANPMEFNFHDVTACGVSYPFGFRRPAARARDLG